MVGAIHPRVDHLPDERGRLTSLYKSSRSLAAVDSLEDLMTELADVAAATVPAQVRRGRVAKALRTASWLHSVGREEEAVGEGLRALGLSRRADVPPEAGRR